MATDTKVTELILNELTEEKLKELEDAGTVPPNEIFFTDDDETSPRGLPLGTIIPAAVISDDASLHLLDGSSLAQSGIYAEFCTWLKNRVLTNSSNVPTCTISEYASEMTTYGQCGKFVINNTSSVQVSGNYRVEANSIKLPTITEFIASNNGGDSIGLAELDMFKSHVHNVGANNQHNYTSGVDTFALGTSGYPIKPYNRNVAYTGGDETRPKNVRYPYYIVVATSVKTDVEVDIDKVASDINEINSTLNKTEQVEVIYDKDDPNKDWGFSSGLYAGQNIPDKDFTKYKRLRVYCSFGTHVAMNFDVDLITPTDNAYIGGTSSFNQIQAMTSANDTDCYFANVLVSLDKTYFRFVSIGWQDINGNFVFKTNTTDAPLTRIEGVY